jgi:hypothetical protein
MDKKQRQRFEVKYLVNEDTASLPRTPEAVAETKNDNDTARPGVR